MSVGTEVAKLMIIGKLPVVSHLFGQHGPSQGLVVSSGGQIMKMTSDLVPDRAPSGRLAIDGKQAVQISLGIIPLICPV